MSRPASRRSVRSAAMLAVVLGLLLLPITTQATASTAPGDLVLRLRDSGALTEGVRLAVLAEGPELIIVNTAGRVVTVFDGPDEPFVRLTAQGVFVQPASTTWLAQARSDVAGVPVNADGYALLDEGADLAWLDPRTTPLAGSVTDEVRAADTETVVARWQIPVDVDGSFSEVEGETVWVPLAARRAGEAPAAVFPYEYVIAGLVLVSIVMLLVRRRNPAE